MKYVLVVNSGMKYVFVVNSGMKYVFVVNSGMKYVDFDLFCKSPGNLFCFSRYCQRGGNGRNESLNYQLPATFTSVERKEKKKQK